VEERLDAGGNLCAPTCDFPRRSSNVQVIFFSLRVRPAVVQMFAQATHVDTHEDKLAL
jgi:hypothetical protein